MGEVNCKKSKVSLCCLRGSGGLVCSSGGIPLEDSLVFPELASQRCSFPKS